MGLATSSDTPSSRTNRTIHRAREPFACGHALTQHECSDGHGEDWSEGMGLITERSRQAAYPFSRFLPRLEHDRTHEVCFPTEDDVFVEDIGVRVPQCIE